MLLKPTNNSLAEIDPALDQSQLYALGLDDVRRFSRQLWTDHNTHDPGITILELLCYALTDLSYRAQFPLEDLLATPTGNAQNMASQFFTAREVLPNRPLTIPDYRKLLIDLPEVRNAWSGTEDRGATLGRHQRHHGHRRSAGGAGYRDERDHAGPVRPAHQTAPV